MRLKIINGFVILWLCSGLLQAKLPVPTTTQAVNQYISKAHDLSYRHPDSTLMLLEAANEASQQLHYEHGQTGVLIEYTAMYLLQHDVPKARKAVLKAYDIASQNGDTYHHALAALQVVDVYSNWLNQHDSAFSYLQEAQELSKQMNDSSLLIKSLFQFHLYYANVLDSAKAEQALLDAVALSEQTQKKSNYRFMLYMAIKYLGEREKWDIRADLVEKYLTSGLSKLKLDQSYDYYHGKVLTLGIDMTKAERIQFLESQLALHQDHDNQVGAFFITLDLAEEYAALGRKQEAEAMFLSAIHSPATEGDAKLHVLGYKKIADFYQQQQAYQKANQYYKQYMQVRDSTLRLELVVNAKELETKYEVAQKEAQLAKQEAELTKQEADKAQLTYALLALGLLAFIILAFYLYRTRHMKLLRAQNETIERALKEKEVLLREIHHRVKNNLQMVSSLLSLQSRYIQDEAAMEAIKQGKARVRSMALIHQSLYQKEDLTSVGVKGYLDKLFQELLATYNLTNQHINLDLDIEDIDLDIDTIIPLGLIVNELVTNSLKYAFEGREQGTLAASLFRQSDHIILKISDDGIGLPEEAKTSNGSFGHVLVETLAAQLDAELSVASKAGTTVKLAFRSN